MAAAGRRMQTVRLRGLPYLFQHVLRSTRCEPTREGGNKQLAADVSGAFQDMFASCVLASDVFLP